jgi:hypothetical protein
MKSLLKWSLALSLIASYSMGYSEVVRIWPESLQVRTKVIQIGDVESFLVDGSCLVTVIQGDRNELTLRGSGLVLDKTETPIENGELKILTERRWIEYSKFWAPKLGCVLTVKDLNKAKTMGGAVIKISPFSTRRLDLEVRDFGRIEAIVNVDKLGSFIDTNGEMVVSGTANQEFVVIGGGGIYQARDLVAQECKVDVFRLGVAYVNVTDTLDATIQEAGKIYYHGNPKHVYQKVSKEGQLIPR